MKNKSYSEQIKSPKWQKRRLEILNRDNFTCQICGSQDKTLHVHHTVYIPYKEIWDYGDNQLITLCEDCHAREHGELLEEVNDRIPFMRYFGLTNYEILRYIFSMPMPDCDIIKSISKIDPNVAQTLKRLAERRERNIEISEHGWHE